MDCPTWGKRLATEQGTRQHHTKVHGEPLPNRTCKGCGDGFEYYPSNKKGVYCPDPVREADEFLGDHYADVHDIERIEREYGHGRFCSLDCPAEWMSETRSGSDHRWRGTTNTRDGGGRRDAGPANATTTNARCAGKRKGRSVETRTYTTSFRSGSSTIPSEHTN